jgi:(2Fe-2S) ferredoxin
MSNALPVEACFVCVNTSCRRGGSEGILRRLTEDLAGTAIQVREQICFGACWMGPNVVLHPQGTWYSTVSPADVPEIVFHIQGGTPVDRLIDESDPGLHDQVLGALRAAIGR